MLFRSSVAGLLNGDPSVTGGLTAQGILEAEQLATAIADDPFDLCIHTEFERVRQTAEIALAGRSITTVVEARLNDPRYGRFERADIDGYRDWATYYCDTHGYGYAVATDDSGNVYMAGTTGSSTGVAFNGFQNTWAGSNDAYLVKFDTYGNRKWATYYGGSSMDEGYAVATDKIGNVYLAGYTYTTTGMASD